MSQIDTSGDADRARCRAAIGETVQALLKIETDEGDAAEVRPMLTLMLAYIYNIYICIHIYIYMCVFMKY